LGVEPFGAAIVFRITRSRTNGNGFGAAQQSLLGRIVPAFLTWRGTGISAESADRLFKAFFTTKSSGMGMGLSICRSIIEAHGGRVWAVPNVPHGTAFHFTLTVNRGDAP
jgi:nitrogen fixation/metabolism regulation signal transduction histidine kinase